MNYYLPPEWAPQSGVLLTWPHAKTAWAASLCQVEALYIELARRIAPRENLLICCYDATHVDHVTNQLRMAAVLSPTIQCMIAPSNDTWTRDHGPITVLHQQHPLLLDFTFNGWGNKFPAEFDNQITRTLHQQQAFAATPLKTVDLVLEGGSIEVDGEGTLLTTSRCLLSPQRNPSLDRKQLEEQLQHWLGINQILWLNHGYLQGDDTDSHIDTLARFTDANTIAYVACHDPRDEHYPEFQRMKEQLQDFKNLQGKPYQLIPLPWPKPKYNADGQRLPASYANFLVINDAVLVPTYDDPADQKALEQIQHCFLQREIIGIASSLLVEQAGAIHCATMQLPLGVL